MSAAHIGHVVSINATLLSVLGDASCVATYRGLERDSDGEIDPDASDTDWARSLEAAADLDEGATHFAIRGGNVLLLAIGGYCGYVWVYRVGATLVLIESTFDGDTDGTHPDVLAFAARPLATDATQVGEVVLPSGILAIVPNTTTGKSIPALLAAKNPTPIDDDEVTGILIPGLAGRYSVHLEPPGSHPFGEATRCFLTPLH